MRTRILFGADGRAHTTRQRMTDWWTGVAAVAVLLVVVSCTGGLDEASDARVRAAQDTRVPMPQPVPVMTEADRLALVEQAERKARDEMAGTVRAAYAQGHREAMAAVLGRPEGLALAQACMAMSTQTKVAR